MIRKRRDGLQVRVYAGRHEGSRSRTMAELLEVGVTADGAAIAPRTVSSYRAAMDRYILPALGKLLD